jgi:hypothetical protein
MTRYSTGTATRLDASVQRAAAALLAAIGWVLTAGSAGSVLLAQGATPSAVDLEPVLHVEIKASSVRTVVNRLRRADETMPEQLEGHAFHIVPEAEGKGVVWLDAAGTIVRRLALPERGLIKVSQNGQYFGVKLGSGSRSALVYFGPDGKELWRDGADGIDDYFHIAPTGRYVVSNNVQTGAVVFRDTTGVLRRCPELMCTGGPAFSADGEYVALDVQGTKGIRVALFTSHGEKVWETDAHGLTQFAVANGGRHVAVTLGPFWVEERQALLPAELLLLDESGQLVWRAEIPCINTLAAAFSPAGDRVGVIEVTDSVYAATVLSVATGARTRRCEFSERTGIGPLFGSFLNIADDGSAVAAMPNRLDGRRGAGIFAIDAAGALAGTYSIPPGAGRMQWHTWNERLGVSRGGAFYLLRWR